MESPAVTRIDDGTGCQCPSKSPKVDNFHLIWKSACHFLLVINSNLGPISHRFQDMASFLLKMHIFLNPLHSITIFTNVSLALDRWNFACLGFRHMTNYSCKKIFPHDLMLSHNTSIADRRQTDDDGQMTNDKCTISSTITWIRSANITFIYWLTAMVTSGNKNRNHLAEGNNKNISNSSFK